MFEKEKIQSCLETIFEFNVMKYANGKGGAVNGMRPDGTVDLTSMQSEEMWVGITAGLASLMIFEVRTRDSISKLTFIKINIQNLQGHGRKSVANRRGNVRFALQSTWTCVSNA